MVTAPNLYFHIKKTLEKNNIESAQFEAMCIMEYLFDTRLQTLLLQRNAVTEEKKVKADNILSRRINGEPLQYLLGKWEFYGLEFYVGEGVLIPRQDTETIIDSVLSMQLNDNPKVLDLCSGSGCIGITLCKNLKKACITAVEISEKAIGYINKNIRHNKVSMDVFTGDVLNAKTASKFSDVDLIVCNPPYLTANDMKQLQKEVTFEPEKALFGGEDGLDFYRKITELWKNTMKKGGFLVYEIGMGQEKSVAEILEKNGFIDIEMKKDLCGITRVVQGKYDGGLNNG